MASGLIISRGEFYGVWGDFDVNITLDKNYKVGATGYLQNAEAIGWGYDKEGSPLKQINGNRSEPGNFPLKMFMILCGLPILIINI